MIARLAAMLTLLCLAFGLSTLAASAQEIDTADPVAFETLHEAYLTDSDLQLERPEPEPVEPPEVSESPGWLNALARWFADVLYFLAPLFRILFYVLIAGLVLWLAYFLFGEALNLRLDRFRKSRDEVVDSHVDDIRPDEAAARSLLDEADALAREGRYAEAVHLLLFRSIEDIQTRKSGGVPRSLTAREIGGLGDLPERARSALGPIIRIVERSFFGGRDVDADGWKTARASYEDFAFGGGWG